MDGTRLWWVDDSTVAMTVAIYLVLVVGEGWVSTATQVVSRKKLYKLRPPEVETSRTAYPPQAAAPQHASALDRQMATVLLLRQI